LAKEIIFFAKNIYHLASNNNNNNWFVRFVWLFIISLGTK